MAATTALTTQAEFVLNQAYDQFRTVQLQRSKTDLFDNAAEIFSITQITEATLLYLFDEEIARRVIELDTKVVTTMYDQARQTEFVKLNFTGNDIRWLLGLPRMNHHRQTS
jgi:hypothetical protein